jgi:transcriptional regulator EpsA
MRIEPWGAAAEAAPRDPEPLRLSTQDATTLVAAITDAVNVRRRFQFFSWTQGRLQALLPHGVLVCGLPRGNGTAMFFDYFHNIPLAMASLSRLCHPREGVAAQMLEAWREAGGDPLAIDDQSPRQASISRELGTLGLGASIAHGIPAEQSICGAHGFFAFVSLQARAGSRESVLAAMMVPHIFSAYCRALSRDRMPSASVSETAGDGALSEREIEILHWVREGKSNHEIGAVLSISPLTVKNHIQRILRKLQASNRTQAVTKAIALRVLRGGAQVGSPGIEASTS